MTSAIVLETSCQTDPGCVRSINEDAVEAAPELGLVVVADGMGGHNAGEVAARMAVDDIVAQMRKALADPASATPDSIEKALRRALVHANSRICAKAAGNSQFQGMGATVVCLVVHGEQATIASLGDSRAYRLRDGKLRLLTRDHSLSQEVRDLGVVGEDAIAASHNRHLISQALGHGDDPQPDLVHMQCVNDDLFLLCSDGLNDMVDGVDIELALRVLRSNLPLAADQLVMIARDNGGYDNITVALARYYEGGKPMQEKQPRQAGSGGGLLGWLKSLFGKGS